MNILKRIMPSDKPKILFVLDEDLLKRLNDFRFTNRIDSKSEAIRRLLDEALKKYESKKQPQK
jgi:metal-responsive CopG/Arc/MetJ family transcriptional regulator